MTYVKYLYKIESQSHNHNEIDDLMRITNDRDANVSGLFLGNATYGASVNNTKIPYKLISYTARVWTTSPSTLWSSEAGNLEHSQPGFNTGLETENMANGIIKKWTLTEDGKKWSILHHRFCGTKPVFSKKQGKWVGIKWGEPRYMKDNVFKIQLQNVDPRQASPTQAYYAVITVELDYDAI